MVATVSGLGGTCSCNASIFSSTSTCFCSMVSSDAIDSVTNSNSSLRTSNDCDFDDETGSLLVTAVDRSPEDTDDAVLRFVFDLFFRENTRRSAEVGDVAGFPSTSLILENNSQPAHPHKLTFSPLQENSLFALLGISLKYGILSNSHVFRWVMPFSITGIMMNTDDIDRKKCYYCININLLLQFALPILYIKHLFSLLNCTFDHGLALELFLKS